nr:hypothetical protein Iba_chr01bCG7410 [Ipomoea batatas]
MEVMEPLEMDKVKMAFIKRASEADTASLIRFGSDGLDLDVRLGGFLVLGRIMEATWHMAKIQSQNYKGWTPSSRPPPFAGSK